MRKCLLVELRRGSAIERVGTQLGLEETRSPAWQTASAMSPPKTPADCRSTKQGNWKCATVWALAFASRRAEPCGARRSQKETAPFCQTDARRFHSSHSHTQSGIVQYTSSSSWRAIAHARFGRRLTQRSASTNPSSQPVTTHSLRPSRSGQERYANLSSCMFL